MRCDLPRVAVLLAAYNGMQWIEEQVDSILEQQGVSVTLFVSVDVSVDGTEAWVEDLARRRVDVILLPCGERFGSAGANFFRLLRDVNPAGFDAVAFADQDDVWFPHKLVRACSLLSCGACDVYSSNVLAFWPDGRQALINKAQPQRRLDHFFEAAGPGCTYVFSIAAVVAFRNFVVSLGERASQVFLHDWLAYAFCRERGFIWHIDARPSMLYRQHAANVVGSNTGLAAFQRRFRLITRSWYRQQVLLIVALVAPSRLHDFTQTGFLLRNFSDLRRRARDRIFLLVMIATGLF